MKLTCPHQFADTPHYCKYIHVPDLLHLLPSAQTTDEQVIIAARYASLLWGNVELHETRGLIRLFLAGHLTAVQIQDASKRVKRLLAIDALCNQQMDITRASLNFISDQKRVSFSTFFLAQRSELGSLTDQLAAISEYYYPSGMIRDVPGDERLLLRQDIRLHQQRIAEQNNQFELIGCLNAENLDEHEVVALSEQTLQDHHPYVLAPLWTGSQDILTFITVHQASEIWLRAACVAITEAIVLLEVRPAHLVRLQQVQWCVRRIATILRLFVEMIRLPQSMTAADYLAFRSEIGHGSGAESYQYRCIEIRLGLRDPRYRENLIHMHLLTSELVDLFEMPSLISTFLDLAEERGVIGDWKRVAQSEIARQLSVLFLPTGTFSIHADLMALAEGLLDIEQAVDEWRHVHLLMVDRMMGNQRPSLGIAGEHATGVYDSKPYLLGTCDYERIFQPLWEARNAVQPHRVADAVMGR